MFRPQKINVLFPEMSQYCLGLVCRQKNVYRKSMKIIKNTLEIHHNLFIALSLGSKTISMLAIQTVLYWEQNALAS